MSEFIQKLDADTNSDGVQFSTSMLQHFFDNDKDYLKKTKESRSVGVEKELLNLNSEGKKQLASSIEVYLNNLNFELQDWQSCKITTLLSNYPSSFSEAMKAVKSWEGKSLNIACALLSLHSILQGKGRLWYDQSKTYAEQYICKDMMVSTTVNEPSSLQTTQNTDKKVNKWVNKEQLLSDKLPSWIFDTVAENHPLKTFTTVQELQTYLISQWYVLPKFWADGKRWEETKKALEKYLSEYKKSTVWTSSTTLPEDTTSVSPNSIHDKDIPWDKQKPTDDIQDKETNREQGNTTTSNSTESLSENNNFEKEKATIVSKTLEIKELVSHKTPKDIEDYINTLRNDKQENPFIVYMAIMWWLNHVNDIDRTAIINNYYTILWDLKKQRNTSSLRVFQDDIWIIEKFLAQHSEYCTLNKKSLWCDNSLISLKDYETKKWLLQFDCSSYSFFVYCMMSEFWHKDIGIAENEAIQHGIFVRKNNSSGNLTPYDFSKIKENGKSSGSQYSDGRDMKDNIPANISLLISEYNAPNATLSTTYFALLGSQYVWSNGNTYYEPTLYDDLAKSIEKSYDNLYNNKKIIITDENYQWAKDLLSIMMSEVHKKVGKKWNDYSEEIEKLADALRTYSKYNL